MEKHSPRPSVKDQRGVLSVKEAQFYAKRLFNRLDRENKGYISLEVLARERLSILSYLDLEFDKGMDAAKDVYDTIDFNNDGKVTEKDLQNVYLQFLANVK